jgi:RNA polymerase sigma factor (sigma-70 family)
VKDLLLRMHAGEHDAAQSLWERVAPRLLAYARLLLKGDGNSAADIVQTVFLKVISCDRATLMNITDPIAWLLAATRHAVIDLLRTRRSSRLRIRKAARHAAAASFMPPTTPAGAHHGSEEFDQVREALARLPRRAAEVILLRHTAGLTFEQIALTLHSNLHTVAARYRRAMIDLRLDLKRASLVQQHSIGRGEANARRMRT